MGLNRHRPTCRSNGSNLLESICHTPCQARFMVLLASLWVEGVAGNRSMSLSSGVRGILRRFSDHGLKPGTFSRRHGQRSESGLTSPEDRQ